MYDHIVAKIILKNRNPAKPSDPVAVLSYFCTRCKIIIEFNILKIHKNLFESFAYISGARCERGWCFISFPKDFPDFENLCVGDTIEVVIIDSGIYSPN